MNITLNDLNRFIEAEKRKEVLPRDAFQTIAVSNFCDTPAEELMATFEVYMHAKAPQWSLNASSYQEFRRMLEEGKIDILQLTGRQRLLFITCLSDPTFEQKMVTNAVENEEHFIKLRKALPIILPALRNSASYTAEQMKVARQVAFMFMECNQKVLNYRRYTKLTKLVVDKEISYQSNFSM